MNQTKKMIDYSTYSSFKDTVASLNEDLEELLDICDELKLSNTADSIRETIAKTADDHFEVAIVGEFKRGKSTLINALLGQDVLPADVLPATATLNRVTYSDEPYVQVEYKDGRSEQVDIDELENYVTKLTLEAEEVAETVKEATVYYDTDFCKNNVDIIDTPGLNDDEQMTNVTLSILPKIDAAVFVISANSPFSQFEKDFLEKKMLTSDVGRIIFVVNCFGTFSPEDEKKIVETVRARITKYVMDKAKLVMGEDSREFAVYKRKIGTPRVIGVYAKRALTAKKIEDPGLLEESNFPEFERALESMLTTERGAITLQILANKITNSGTEILRSVVLQENALMMANDEFMEHYDQAIREIDDIRNKKRMEFVRINSAANQVFDDLRPVLDNYWDNIERTAMGVINNYSMTSDDFKRDKLKLVTVKLTDKIKESIQDRAQIICEQIQNSINAAVTGEVERLQQFEDEFFEGVTRIQEMFDMPDKISKNGTASDKGIGAALSSFSFGAAGGVFMGFREAGVKGAVIGGVTGAAGWSAVFLPAMLLLNPSTAVIALLFVSAGLIGSFTAGFTIDTLLINDRIDRYKDNFKAQMKKQFHEMRMNNDFTETVRRQVYNAFDGLKAKIEQETEIILRDTQETLDNLNAIKNEKSTVSEREMDRLHSIAQRAGNIVSGAYAVRKAVSDQAAPVPTAPSAAENTASPDEGNK